MYEDRANNRAYMTQSAKLSINPSQLNVEEVLDAGVASLSEDGDTVTGLHKISMFGLPGREITVLCTNGTVMKMRAFVNPKVPAMYIAVVGPEKGNLDFPEAQAFLDSVSIPQK